MTTHIVLKMITRNNNSFIRINVYEIMPYTRVRKTTENLIKMTENMGPERSTLTRGAFSVRVYCEILSWRTRVAICPY